MMPRPISGGGGGAQRHPRPAGYWSLGESRGGGAHPPTHYPPPLAALTRGVGGAMTLKKPNNRARDMGVRQRIQARAVRSWSARGVRCSSKAIGEGKEHLEKKKGGSGGRGRGGWHRRSSGPGRTGPASPPVGAEGTAGGGRRVTDNGGQESRGWAARCGAPWAFWVAWVCLVPVGVCFIKYFSRSLFGSCPFPPQHRKGNQLCFPFVRSTYKKNPS